MDLQLLETVSHYLLQVDHRFIDRADVANRGTSRQASAWLTETKITCWTPIIDKYLFVLADPEAQAPPI